jgi:hypothetical protein
VLSDAILPVVGSALFLTGLCVLLLLLISILREIRRDSRTRRTNPRAFWRIDLRRAVWLLLAVACIASANLTFWVNQELRLYSPVVPGVPLGTISIMYQEGMLPRLVYASTDQEGRQALEVFPVRDAVFRLRGEAIRWAPSLHFLGLGEHFKLSRIEFYPKDNYGPGQSTYAVDVRKGPTDLFRQIQRLQKWLPFVKVETLDTDVWDASHEYSRPIFLTSDHIVTPQMN